MRQAIEREQYRMLVDDRKNRILFEAWGDIVEPAHFVHFAEDWQNVCAHMKPGFTVLGDYTRTGAFFLKDSFSKGMKAIYDAGVRKVAVFWGTQVLGKMTTELSAAAASSEYAAKRKSFKTRAEAEAWLDV